MVALVICSACEAGQHEHHVEVVEAVPEGMYGGKRCRCRGECVDGRYAKTKVRVLEPTVAQMGDPRAKEATWTLMPPPPGVCSQCARDHEPELPHDAQSLHYQYAFYAEHGCWPTWGDAMAHCDELMREIWTAGLRDQGVSDEQLRPSLGPPDRG